MPHAMPLTRVPLTWESTEDPRVPFAASHQNRRYTLRINDFPAEALYTLFADGEELGDLEDWPSLWTRPAGA